MAKLSTFIKSIRPIDSAEKVDILVEELLKRRTVVSDDIVSRITKEIIGMTTLEQWNSKIVKGDIILVKSKPKKKKKNLSANQFRPSETDPIVRIQRLNRMIDNMTVANDIIPYDIYEYGMSDW